MKTDNFREKFNLLWYIISGISQFLEKLDFKNKVVLFTYFFQLCFVNKPSFQKTRTTLFAAILWEQETENKKVFQAEKKIFQFKVVFMLLLLSLNYLPIYSSNFCCCCCCYLIWNLNYSWLNHFKSLLRLGFVVQTV